jgi:hypothetical protein
LLIVCMPGLDIGTDAGDVTVTPAEKPNNSSTLLDCKPVVA